MMAPLYVHPKCKAQMRCKKNEVYVIEMADFGPAAIWYADLWTCPGCGFEIVAGFAPKPIVEHYEDNFAAHLANAEGCDHVYYC